jgi:hypothetical protein
MGEDSVFQFMIESDKEAISINDRFTINLTIKNTSDRGRQLNPNSFLRIPAFLGFYYLKEDTVLSQINSGVSQTVSYYKLDNIIIEAGDEYSFHVTIQYRYEERYDMRTLTDYKGELFDLGPSFIPISSEYDNIIIRASFKDDDGNIVVSNRVVLNLVKR